MMRIIFILVFLFGLVSHLEAATIYIDNAGSMTADCTAGNYSIASRNCTGSAGNAYNDIQAALSASGTNDILYFRTGDYTSNASSSTAIFIKQGQTWATYPGDMPSRATVRSSTHTRIFQIECVTAGTIKDLILVGATASAIYGGYASNYVLENLDISGNNSAAVDYNHQVTLGDSCGDSCLGGSCPAFSQNATIRNNVFHNPVAQGPGQFNACLSASNGVSGFLIEDNVCSGNGMGIWSDVAGGNPALAGRTRITVQRNVVHNIDWYCYHIEARSSWIMRNNIGYDCRTVGIFSRQGGTVDQTEIYNNTVWDCSQSCFSFAQHGASDTATNLKVWNNIFATGANAAHVFTVSANVAAESTNSFNNNLIYSSANNNGICWQQPTGSGYGCIGESYADTSAGISSWEAQCSPATCSGNISGDPLFVNAAGADFHLQSGSPAKGAGATIGIVTTDFAGATRTAPYSIGAYELDDVTGRNRAVVISRREK